MNNDQYRSRVASELLGTTKREFEQYFKHYDQLVVLDHNVHIVQVQKPQPGDLTPITHTDVLAAARVIREDPTRTLDETTEVLYKQLQTKHSRARVNSVVLVATRVMFMVDPAMSGPIFVPFHLGVLSEGFGELGSAKQAIADRRVIKAWKLKTRSGIIFKGTDNLAQHLLLDRPSRVLYIFHHTSFLIAQLSRFQDSGFNQDEDPLVSLQRGSLPPRLLAETLHSLQSILFQWKDRRSIRILKRLIKRKGFDGDCAWHEGNPTFKNSLNNDEYFYWGHRIAELHNLVVDRRPRNRFEQWMKWQTSEGNAFAIALAALMISVAVGLLSLALSAFQVWITWKAWKDSIKTGSDS